MALSPTSPLGLPQQYTQHRAFKGQAYPNATQAQVLHGWFGSSRYIYNALLHLMQYSYHVQQGQQEALSSLKPRPDLECLYPLMGLPEVYDEYLQRSYKVSPNKGFFQYLTSCLKSHPDKAWLHEVPRDVLTYTADSLHKAFQSFYRLVKLKKHIGPQGLIGFPRYKSRKAKQSIRMQGFNSEIATYGTRSKRHDIWLPQSRGLRVTPGYLKVKGLRKLQGRVLSIAIGRDTTGDYSVCVLTEALPRVHQAGVGTIGIDMTAQRHEVGYAQDDHKAFKLSDILQAPQSIQAIESRIVHLQRLLARKTKGSRHWHRMRLKLAQAHQRLQGIYQAYYHQLTNWLLRTYDTIILEDLDVKGMLAKGHSRLSKLIQDSRFSLFKQLLAYKVEQSDYGQLAIADRYYPSTQLCSACGSRPSVKLPLYTEAWDCATCGAHHHRDFNAAKNLYQLKAQLQDVPADKHLILLEAYHA